MKTLPEKMLAYIDQYPLKIWVVVMVTTAAYRLSLETGLWGEMSLLSLWLRGVATTSTTMIIIALIIIWGDKKFSPTNARGVGSAVYLVGLFGTAGVVGFNLPEIAAMGLQLAAALVATIVASIIFIFLIYLVLPKQRADLE